jgi:hypothetical protein
VEIVVGPFLLLLLGFLVATTAIVIPVIIIIIVINCRRAARIMEIAIKGAGAGAILGSVLVSTC